MDTVLEIVLIVVVVAKETCRYLVFLEHGHESRYVRIVALAAFDGRHRRMVRSYEAEVRGLAVPQILLQPTALLAPEHISRGVAG